tara:strand:- start:11819 stop:12274 length:456 start_codon:yes stop_codon:yes gene_type:complete
MKKNIIILILSAFVITSCGYKSIYSSKNLNFNILEFEVEDKTKISRKIKNNLDSYKKNDSNNFYAIKINSKKNINIISKDSEGNPSNFEMTIISEITILNDEKIVKNKVFSESFNYKNSSNKFDLKQYEKNIEENLTNEILENIISYFYTL